MMILTTINCRYHAATNTVKPTNKYAGWVFEFESYLGRERKYAWGKITCTLKKKKR